jgi:hypothetical protein
LVSFVVGCFRAIEQGVANEVHELIDYLNRQYAGTDFNRIEFKEVQRLAGTCTTGCRIGEVGAIARIPAYKGFLPRLVQRAASERSAERLVS